MTARMVAELRSMPWTPRARRIGRFLEGAGMFTLIMFGPSIAVAVVRWVLP